MGTADELRYHRCFGCGADNEQGLRLGAGHEGPDGRYHLPVVLADHFRGAEGVIHGGIQATVLDEVIGKAIHHFENAGPAIVTADFSLRYRRPAPIGQPLVAVAWIDRREGPWVWGGAELLDEAGTVLTTATARWKILDAPS